MNYLFNFTSSQFSLLTLIFNLLTTIICAILLDTWDSMTRIYVAAKTKRRRTEKDKWENKFLNSLAIAVLHSPLQHWWIPWSWIMYEEMKWERKILNTRKLLSYNNVVDLLKFNLSYQQTIHLYLISRRRESFTFQVSSCLIYFHLRELCVLFEDWLKWNHPTFSTIYVLTRLSWWLLDDD